MDCIRCHGRMAKKDQEGVLVDHCTKCGGVWLDAGELDALERGKNRGRADLAREARQEIAREEQDLFQVVGMCPKCHAARLRAIKKRGAELDYCPACHGMFFDETELESVRDAKTGGFIDAMLMLFRRDPA